MARHIWKVWPRSPAIPTTSIRFTISARLAVVEGQAALTLALDSFDYPIDRIEVGREYDVEFDNRGYVVAFAPAK